RDRTVTGVQTCALPIYRSAETDWLLESWSFVLEALDKNPQSLIGGVDWITKRWLLETFMESEKLKWDDCWLQSIDLEYHNIDPRSEERRVGKECRTG